MDASLLELHDAISDLRRANIESADGEFARIVAILDQEPLRSILAAVLQPFDFDGWWASCAGLAGRSAGGNKLRWPTDRATRVACQIVLCRRDAAKQLGFIDFAYHFIGRDSPEADLRAYCSAVIDPLVRDLERLAAQRVPPPV